MQIAGEWLVPAPRMTVWQSLNDPEVLQASVPGCRRIVKLSDGEYEAVLQTRVGPVLGEFEVRLMLSDLAPPERYTLTGEGCGGLAAFCRGTLKVSLEAVSEGTRIVYSAELALGGRVAQVGARLAEPVARKLADAFFRTLEATCTARSVPESGIVPDQKANCSVAMALETPGDPRVREGPA
jgi:carbon monoxide dehydrogenase subunit G